MPAPNQREADARAPQRDSRQARPSAQGGLRRRLRPPRSLRPTRAGWNFFIITFCVGFAALNTGNNLLYLVLSLMLSFVVLSGVLSESALRGIEVRRRLPQEAHAGAAATVVVDVHNALRRFPSFAIVIEDCIAPAPNTRSPLGAVAGRAFALRIGARETESRAYPLLPERRGDLAFSGFRVSTRFPFGLFLKSRSIFDAGSLLVYPPIEARPLHRPERGRGSEGSGGGRIAQSGAQVAGLREWTRSDSMRRVHWKSSLRRDTWQVVEVEDEHDAEVEVELRTHFDPADAAFPLSEPSSESFEASVSRAASDVVGYLDAGFRVALATSDDHIGADRGRAHRRQLMTLLARVQAKAASPRAAVAAAERA